MSGISGSDRVDLDRRRLFGAVALAIAAGELGLTGLARAQAERPGQVPAIRPGTNTSFAPLKQIDAGAPHPEPAAYTKKFSGKYEHRTIAGGVGHNSPQEAPQAFAQAVVDVAKG
jgi:hypothetical protein